MKPMPWTLRPPLGPQWQSPVRLLLAVALLLGGALTFAAPAPVQAQSSGDFWGEAINLSHSGSAEAPVMALGPAGELQVFWWDRFDGLLTALNAGPGQQWSLPQPAPLGLVQVVGEGEEATTVTTPLTAMPQLLPDGNGRVHAWWLGPSAGGTGMRPLWHSVLRVGQTTWATPDTVAESALAWQMAPAPDGSLHLVYLRPVNTANFPSGIYYKRSTDGGTTWSSPSLIASSLYFRLLDTATARLAVQAVGNEVFIAWDDPRPARTVLVRSADGGVTWSPPEPLTAEPGARAPRLVPFQRITAFYEAGQPCALYARALELDLESPVALFQGANVCGQALRFFPLEGETALFLAGAGTGALTLALWDGAQFSEPRTLTASFRDTAMDSQIALDSLSVLVRGGTLLAAGRGQDGEIWALEGALDLQTWVFAPPPIWSAPAPVAAALPVAPASAPVAALDAAGRLHLLWSAPQAEGQPGAALVYARKEGERWSAPATVLRSPQGKSDQPAFVAAADRLHVVWSGGADGRIYYSQAFARDAATAAGWSDPRALTQAPSSSPQIVADLLGRLHVIYAIPLNEGRGIYYTYSDDAGSTWSEPMAVFDAEAAGWLNVLQPSLTVDEQGRLLAVWLRAPLPGNGPVEGVYAARALTGDEFWTEPELLVEGAMASPRAVATLKGQTLVVWYDAARATATYRLSLDGGASWTLASQIPGLRALQGPPAVAAGGDGSAHLAALVENTAAASAPALALAHLIWDGERWTAAPALALSPDLQPAPALTAPGLGLAASAPLGRLEAAFSARLPVAAGTANAVSGAAAASWSILYTARPLPVAESVTLPQFERATPTPTPLPASTPTPTPRPQINPDAPGVSMPVVAAGPITLPVIALGGLALALLLVIALVVTQSRRR